MMTGMPASSRNCLGRPPPNRVPCPAAAMMATFIIVSSEQLLAVTVHCLLLTAHYFSSFFTDTRGRGANVAHGAARRAVEARLLGPAVLACLFPEAAEDHFSGRRLQHARDGDISVPPDQLA